MGNNHVWSRSRVYDKGDGTKVVVPPPVELALLLLQDRQRRAMSRTCAECKSPINTQTGTCIVCGHLPIGPTSAWPARKRSAADRLFWMLAAIIFFGMIGSVLILLIAYGGR